MFWKAVSWFPTTAGSSYKVVRLYHIRSRQWQGEKRTNPTCAGLLCVLPLHLSSAPQPQAWWGLAINSGDWCWSNTVGLGHVHGSFHLVLSYLCAAEMACIVWRWCGWLQNIFFTFTTLWYILEPQTQVFFEAIYLSCSTSTTFYFA